MVFPKLNLLSTIIQVADKIRLDASMTFSNNGTEILTVEIEPESGVGFIEVYNSTSNITDQEKWFVDWAYEVDGDKQVSVRATWASGTKTRIYTVSCITEEDDALFSNDDDLLSYEPDLYRLLPLGCSSFNYAHRKAQSNILASLDRRMIYKKNNERFTKFDVMDKEGFKEWSVFQVLVDVFGSNQSGANDLFLDKKLQYEALLDERKTGAALRLDADGDGQIDDIPYTIRTSMLIRR